MDSRRLFDPLTTRKSEWSEMDVTSFGLLSLEQQEALRGLPVVRVPAGQSAFAQIHPGHQAVPLELVVLRGREVFYVCSEGYGYARYGFRVAGLTGCGVCEVRFCGGEVEVLEDGDAWVPACRPCAWQVSEHGVPVRSVRG